MQFTIENDRRFIVSQEANDKDVTITVCNPAGAVEYRGAIPAADFVHMLTVYRPKH